MPLPLETLLAAGLIAVYLVDSASFLALGEAVIVTRAGTLRHLASGSALELGGRRPFRPNPLAPLVGACALLIVIAAPLALTLAAPRVFLVCALLCYLCAALAGTLIVMRRVALGLTLLQALALAVIGVVCLPCSANLARAAGARRRWLLAASEIPALGFGTAQ